MQNPQEGLKPAAKREFRPDAVPGALRRPTIDCPVFTDEQISWIAALQGGIYRDWAQATITQLGIIRVVDQGDYTEEHFGASPSGYELGSRRPNDHLPEFSDEQIIELSRRPNSSYHQWAIWAKEQLGI